MQASELCPKELFSTILSSSATAVVGQCPPGESLGQVVLTFGRPGLPWRRPHTRPGSPWGSPPTAGAWLCSERHAERLGRRRGRYRFRIRKTSGIGVVSCGPCERVVGSRRHPDFHQIPGSRSSCPRAPRRRPCGRADIGTPSSRAISRGAFGDGGTHPKLAPAITGSPGNAASLLCICVSSPRRRSTLQSCHRDTRRGAPRLEAGRGPAALL